MYFYEDHLYGNLYWSNELYDDETLHCDMCGEDDIYLGEADSPDELKDLLDITDYYTDEYINKVIKEAFEQG